jgi:putative transposase
LSFPDCARFCAVLFGTRAVLAAENLFLRKQLALFEEREKKGQSHTAADCFVFLKLACLFDWRNALALFRETQVRRSALNRNIKSPG